MTDVLDAETRALIDAARGGHEPSAANRARVGWGLEQRLARGEHSSSTGRARSKLSPGSRRFVAAAAGVGALALSGSAAAWWWTQSAPSAKVSVATETLAVVEANVNKGQRRLMSALVAAAQDESVRAKLAAEPAIESTASDAGEEVAVAEPQRAGARDLPSTRAPVVRKASPEEREQPESALAAETGLLSQAQQATNQGNASEALRLLGQYDQRYAGSGALAQERSMARILALCALGRNKQARSEAERFLKRWLKSPQAVRLRDSCALTAAPNSER